MTELLSLFLRLLLPMALALLLFLFVLSLAFRLRPFLHQLRYLNMEIARSQGEERRYWEKQKRRLWRTLLPFSRN